MRYKSNTLYGYAGVVIVRIHRLLVLIEKTISPSILIAFSIPIHAFPECSRAATPSKYCEVIFLVLTAHVLLLVGANKGVCLPIKCILVIAEQTKKLIQMCNT